MSQDFHAWLRLKDSTSEYVALSELCAGNYDVNEIIGPWSPLFAACVRGRLDFLQWLLLCGADPNKKVDGSWATPLELCAIRDFLGCAHALCKAGAIIDEKVVSAALRFPSENTAFICFLIDRGAFISEQKIELFRAAPPSILRKFPAKWAAALDYFYKRRKRRERLRALSAIVCKRTLNKDLRHLLLSTCK